MQTTEETLMAEPENPEYLNMKASRVAQESWQMRAQHSEKQQKWRKMDSERWLRMTHKIEETLEKFLAVFVWQQPVEEPQGHANER